ncbi:inosine 5'-monophosphate dehydrogenase [bacterium BMS3Abin03]|nr:inosine 5'-monophosphate dehydrogenase [bacterium BMS3Abin03]
METIRQILQRKGNQIHSVSPDTTVYDALKLMADKNIGAVLVLDKGKLCGIMSERDYARKVVLHGKISKEIPVREIMSSNVICVEPDQTINNTKAIMINKRIRHLPVMENDELIGLVSIGDIVNAVIDKSNFMIDQLVTYIKGVPEPKEE